MKLSEMSPADREQWLRKLHEILVMRRSTMFRFVAEAVRVLVFGNAGGIAMTMGLMSASDRVEPYHWSIVATLFVFVLGVLFSALTLGLVSAVSVKEAHGAEVALDAFVRDRMERDDVLFFNDDAARRLAGAAAGCGLVGMALLMLGAFSGLFQIALFL